MQKNQGIDEGAERLVALARLEELAEKKAKIHSRLLMDAALAKDMEALSFRHQKRKEKLMALATGKQVKPSKEEEE
ncbi:MAG: hypothetical protein E7377_02010 [Clostridiales bacterium]|nr:hypothetical protein [Clostridiales bacterium]